MLVAISEAAERTGIPEITIRVWCKKGKLKTARQSGRVWLVDLEEVRQQPRRKAGRPPGSRNVNNP